MEEAKWVGEILRRNWFIKHVIKGSIEDEEAVSSYWLILRKRKDMGN
jgi:hypothetical protein